tara:strand:+ start:2898 stop:3257 length:360 start_codon:yes stop_codon:yes gene_type:complete
VNRDNLRKKSALCPLSSELDGQVFQIKCGSLPDAKHWIVQPREAQSAQLFIEKAHALKKKILTQFPRKGQESKRRKKSQWKRYQHGSLAYQLLRQKRNMVNDGKPDPPLLIFCKLDNRR